MPAPSRLDEITQSLLFPRRMLKLRAAPRLLLGRSERAWHEQEATAFDETYPEAAVPLSANLGDGGRLGCDTGTAAAASAFFLRGSPSVSPPLRLRTRA